MEIARVTGRARPRRRAAPLSAYLHDLSQWSTHYRLDGDGRWQPSYVDDFLAREHCDGVPDPRGDAAAGFAWVGGGDFPAQARRPRLAARRVLRRGAVPPARRRLAAAAAVLDCFAGIVAARGGRRQRAGARVLAAPARRHAVRIPRSRGRATPCSSSVSRLEVDVDDLFRARYSRAGVPPGRRAGRLCPLGARARRPHRALLRALAGYRPLSSGSPSGTTSIRHGSSSRTARSRGFVFLASGSQRASACSSSARPTTGR